MIAEAFFLEKVFSVIWEIQMKPNRLCTEKTELRVWGDQSSKSHRTDYGRGKRYTKKEPRDLQRFLLKYSIKD